MHTSYVRFCVLMPVVVIIPVALVVGCSGAENYEQAYIKESGNAYVVEMRGTRYFMAHDPISLLLGKTYETGLTVQIPRAEGTVEGREIPVEPGHYNYLGTIAINGDRMNVDLYYDNYDDNIRDPVSWNGQYILVRVAPEEQ